jgi:hypothetical protein
MQARDGSAAAGPWPGPPDGPDHGPIRVAVIGAGRTRYGTGPFVARRLVEHGAEVVAVSTASLATAEAAARGVSTMTGRTCEPFTSAGAMLGAVAPDAVAICSPAHAHLDHLRLALDHGLHTFCEKPLVDVTSGRAALHEAAQVVAGFAARGCVLHLNTQWTHVLGHLERLYELEALPPLRALRVELEPPVRGREMVREAVPHANSLLLELAPAGRAEDLRAEMSEGGERLAVHFTWQASSPAGQDLQGADVTYLLQWRDGQPRRAAFEVNGMRVERTVDLSRDYRITFSGNGRSVAGVDPLAASVKAFLRAARAHPAPSGAILRNLELMVDIAGELEKPPADALQPVQAGVAGQAG